MAEPQVVFSHSTHPELAHDMAQPISVAIPCQGLGADPIFLLKAVGGLTKLEHVAAMIMATSSGSELLNDQQQMNWAIECVERAEKLLEVCARHQTPKPSSAIEVAG